MPGTPFTPFTPSTSSWSCCAAWPTTPRTWSRTPATSSASSIADMREANRRWQAMLRSPRARGAAARYRSVLGAPESARGRAGSATWTCEALLWPVPLWPDLRFEVLLAPNGAVWNEWLVRAPGAPGPGCARSDDLRPWSCTVDEVARAFAPARPLEGTAPTRWRLAFTAAGGRRRHGGHGYGVRGSAETAGQRCVADFTWGLLQEVTVGG